MPVIIDDSRHGPVFVRFPYLAIAPAGMTYCHSCGRNKRAARIRNQETFKLKPPATVNKAR